MVDHLPLLDKRRWCLARRQTALRVQVAGTNVELWAHPGYSQFNNVQVVHVIRRAIARLVGIPEYACGDEP